jgi:hypothetical protein
LEKNKASLSTVQSVGLAGLCIVFVGVSLWMEERDERARAAARLAAEQRERSIADEKEKRVRATREAEQAALDAKLDAPPTPVPECSCSLPSTKGQPQLLMRVLHSSTLSMSGVVKKSFDLVPFTEVAGARSQLAATRTTAPPASHEGVLLDLAMACHEGSVTFVGPTSASSWALETGALRWTTPFGQRFGLERFEEGDLKIVCHPTEVKKGILSVVSAPGGPKFDFKIRLNDGTLL